MPMLNGTVLAKMTARNLFILSLLVEIVFTTAIWNATCPDKCNCKVQESIHFKGILRTVNCTHKKLQTIPQDVPLDVESLLLSENSIVTVHEHLPKYTQLKEIDLSKNRIASLGMHPMFENLTSLTYLNLADNNLQSLLHGSFSGLLNLDDLILSSNHIGNIEEHSFGGLNHLQTLSLAGNQLEYLNSVWFQGMSNLDTLLLDDNKITEIPDNIFEHLEKLSTLSLADNQVSNINKSAFWGLDKLQYLTLDRNKLSEVPSKSMSMFESLKILSLDSNPLITIEELDFQNLNVAEIILNNMVDLTLVDYHAFFNLRQLTILQLHDNPKLAYIDPDAFVNMPNLQKLYLHNNKLMALHSNILYWAPILQEITFYHNPIQCDCNVHWIKQIMSNESFNGSLSVHPSLFPESDKFICATPLEMNAKLLKTVPLEKIPQLCKPTVIAFFNDSYPRELGKRITYECRAIGVTHPHIHWILNNGKIVNNTSNFSHVRLSKLGTLSLGDLKASDAGTYTCVATNEIGYDTSSTVLSIHSKDIHILHKGVATNFITVTWNGTGSTISTSEYLILYRKQGSDEEYGKIHLRPYMRTYTITNLLPQTMYEFCIAYEHNKNLMKLNCINIKTKHKMYVMNGIHTLGSMSILIVVGVTFASLLFLCLSIALIKRYRRRKLYKEPEGVNTTTTTVATTEASNVKVEQMSHIPLDNLYHPPSTPLCTSRTSLIGTSNA